MVKVLKVGHYNPWMKKQDSSQILGGTQRSSRAAQLAAMLLCGLLLASCGQKGPLFLPPGSVPKAAPPAGSPGAPAPASPTDPDKVTR
jgi:predicted small lipoprotein YifL